MSDAATFHELWAGMRTQLARGIRADPSEIEALADLAASPTEDAMVGAVEIEAGAISDDGGLHGRGVARLRGASLEDQLRLMASLPDLTILGPATSRRSMFRSFWAEVVPADGDAVAFLTAPSTYGARRLIDHGLRTPGLDGNLDQELRRQVGWQALESWSVSREREYLELAKSSAVRLPETAASGWEYQLVLALLAVTQGFVAEGVARVKAVLDGPARSGWKRRQVSRAMTAWGVWAAPSVSQWNLAMPYSSFPPHEAAGPDEHVGSAACLMARESRQRRSALAAIDEHLPRRPHAAFLLLLELAGADESDQVARHLQAAIVQDPDVVACLPWQNRVESFVDACAALADAQLRLSLLAMAAPSAGTPVLGRAARDALETLDGPSMRAVPRDQLHTLASAHAATLSAPTRMMVDRGLVYRAVVDGSNVCLAGSFGGTGDVGLVEQVLADLDEAGFREIRLFFDASTRHRVPDEHWRVIEKWVVDGRAEVVRGQADPHIIRCFLEDPEGSWIVTADDYVEPMVEVPALAPFWFKHRLHFHFTQARRIGWDRPLNQPELPSGAPRVPRRR